MQNCAMVSRTLVLDPAADENILKVVPAEAAHRPPQSIEDGYAPNAQGDDHQEQAYLLWLAVCRRYRFIYDFSVEVIRERFLTLRYGLSYEDFDTFFNEKMEWHEEMEKVTTTTRKKLRQFLFKMLRETELINANESIIPAMLSPRLIDSIRRHGIEDLRIYPMLESELQGYAV